MGKGLRLQTTHGVYLDWAYLEDDDIPVLELIFVERLVLRDLVNHPRRHLPRAQATQTERKKKKKKRTNTHTTKQNKLKQNRTMFYLY